MKLTILAVIIIAIIIAGPLATIASLNTLFGLGIEVTFSTWLSALWLAMVVGGAVHKAGK